MSDDKKIIFSMTGLSKSYNNNNNQVLKDIYLSFFYGAKIGIIGLNGSGKSVSTFYSMYKQEPTGKYLLSVCKSISCEINNSKEIIDVVKDFTGLNNNETDENDLFTFEAVECIGACGGAPAMQINYETVEGLSSENTIKLCEWLKEEQPDVIIAEEMQDNFGGTKSFDWAIKDQSGTTGSVPGFQTFNTTKEKK